MRSPSFCGIILAAGSSTRMGTDKALLPWHGSNFLAAHIASLEMCTDQVLVIAGTNLEAIAGTVNVTAATLVLNPHPERGQFSSLQVGVRQVLNLGRDAALVALVDRPPAAAATVQRLKEEAVRAFARGIWAVVPSFEGKHGHPIVIGREMIEAFLRAPQDATARDVEHAHQQHIHYLEVDDAAIGLNVNTPADFQQLQSPEPRG